MNSRQKRGFGWLVVGALLAVSLGTARATLWVQEGFDYPAGSDQNSWTGGVGFAVGSNWDTNGVWGSASIVATSLTYPGIASLGGGALRATADKECIRTLTVNRGGATHYISMLVNINNKYSNRCGIMTPKNGGPCFGRVDGGWGFFGGWNGMLGISNVNGNYQTWRGVSRAADALTHLFIVKLDFEANAIKIWVDPLPDGNEPPPDATLQTGGDWTINLSAGSTWDNISHYTGTYGGSSDIDDVRIGTTWGDVVPATTVSPSIEEGYNYPVSSTLDGTQTGGVGFAASSSWHTEYTSDGLGIAAGLTYPGLASAGSNALMSTSYSYGKRMTTPFAGGRTWYMSQLIKCPSWAARVGYALGNEGGWTGGPTFGYVQDEADARGWGMFGQNQYFGMDINGYAYGATSGPFMDYPAWTAVTNATDGVTHLFVTKYDREANNVKIYIDPTVVDGEPATPTAVLATGGRWVVNLNNMVLGALEFTGIGANSATDELRIGPTWGSVAPPQVGTWTQIVGGAYAWVTRANWQGALVPNPTAGSTVDCSAANLAGDVTLALNGTRTLTTWKFGDTAGAQNWFVTPGWSGSKLVLAGAAPTIQVGQNTTTITAPIEGTAGLTKTGAGTLRLGVGSQLPSGGLTLAGGTLELASGSASSPGTLAVTADSTLALGDGTSPLTFTGDSTALMWSGNLALTGTLGNQAPTALRFSPYGLTTAQLRRITIDGLGVHLDSNGYLLPGQSGTLIQIR